MRAYAPRPVSPLPLRVHEGWRIMPYAISWDAALPVDGAAFAEGVSPALSALPTAAVGEGRPGLALVVRWDRQNELPVRGVLRTSGESERRAARGGESSCVRDLPVPWFEREAYVATVLADVAPDGAEEEHLSRRLEVVP